MRRVLGVLAKCPALTLELPFPKPLCSPTVSVFALARLRRDYSISLGSVCARHSLCYSLSIACARACVVVSDLFGLSAAGSLTTVVFIYLLCSYSQANLALG